MRLHLYVALALSAIALAVRGRRRRVPQHEDVPIPWPPWKTRDLGLAIAAFVVAGILAAVRLQSPYEARGGCSATFGSIVNAGAEHGMVYLDALVVLALPALVIGWLRRDARWAIAGLLVIVTGFAACWEAAADFHCPPGT